SMQNHGLVTVGRTAREAFVLMKYLVSAAEIQLRLEATGSELIEIPAAICEKTAAQFESHDAGRGGADWPAYMRLLDGIDAGYKQYGQPSSGDEVVVRQPAAPAARASDRPLLPIGFVTL